MLAVREPVEGRAGGGSEVRDTLERAGGREEALGRLGPDRPRLPPDLPPVRRGPAADVDVVRRDRRRDARVELVAAAVGARAAPALERAQEDEVVEQPAVGLAQRVDREDDVLRPAGVRQGRIGPQVGHRRGGAAARALARVHDVAKALRGGPRVGRE